MVLDALLVVVVLVGLFVCFVIACHCKITAYVGDNKLILILSYLLQTNTLTHPHTNKQTDAAENIRRSSLRYDVG